MKIFSGNPELWQVFLIKKLEANTGFTEYNFTEKKIIIYQFFEIFLSILLVSIYELFIILAIIKNLLIEK
jgi:hypothetical protein